MRARTLLLTLAVTALSCGRTEPLRYTSDASADDDAGTDAGHVGCRNGTIDLVPAIPKVMFVLDRSGSMSSFFGSVRATRWSSLTNALANVLPPVDQTMDLGAEIFPSGAGDSCQVAASPIVTPDVGQVSRIVGIMRGTQPSGQTPTASAIEAAGTFLLSSHAASSARAMVLATDGEPNCNTGLDPRSCVCTDTTNLPFCSQSIQCLDDTRTVDTIRSFASQNLPTYVIGIQDVDTVAVGVLNQMAQAGGHPQPGFQSYYAVTSQGELETALTTIRNQVGSCVYLTSSVPDDDGSLVLDVGSTVAAYDPTGVNGWTWSNKDNGELVLHGAPCNVVVANPNTVVSAVVLCSKSDGGVDAGSPDGG